MSKSSNAGNTMRTVSLVINFVMALVIGGLAWYTAPMALVRLKAMVPAVARLGLSDLLLQIGVGVLIFIVGMLIVAILISLILPSDKQSTTEKAIAQDQAKRFEKKRKTRGGKRSNRRRT